MSSQRLRKNNSPASSKLQPLKATVPLASLIRNTSPTRKKQSPVSSPVQTLERKKRRSPDVFFSEHRALVSPLGDKHKGLKLNLNIRRTNSSETLSSTYVNGQWPKDVPHTPSHTSVNAGTQTISLEESQDEATSQHRRSSSLGSGDKEKFRQYLQRTKNSQPIHGRQSPIQVDHSAVGHLYGTINGATQSRAIPIPVISSSASSKVQSLHIRRSVEGLNTEIEKLGLGTELPEPPMIFDKTPEGHRGPLASLLGKSIDAQTQTDNGYVDPIELITNIPSSSGNDSRSQSTSPSWIGSAPCIDSGGIPRCSSGDSPETSIQFLKFSSSPKPNNSFLFARGPPDGAEKITLSIEHRDDGQEPDEAFCCPDKSKVKILFSQNSPFYALPSVPRMTVGLPSATSSPSSQMT